MFKKLALTTAFMFSAGVAMAADPVEGIWKTTPDDNGNFGHIQIAPCGAKICGTLIKAFDSSGAQVESENVGRAIIWDMQALGGGKYGKGKVWAPDRDKTYNSKMALSGDSLAISGCVLGICRDGGQWNRVK
ncbi:imidazoleglycerol-phosphate dehydratase [Actibacterium mucosum KCTC 23349]|uniref:Imidazoleglycerol-phosphate dehydratase n=1 Tax=Actibacterium mucosum KCTC 23349 TaxID=1454373 RepID=A0A037ZHB1_9RHOB|nr:DUF2147 domain-containing protein [Actibacterium mucosum]KAJ55009.1 imidazoleglycerol-phosphate dehydratase [Actibacterium mucosum KCTC 23349]